MQDQHHHCYSSVCLITSLNQSVVRVVQSICGWKSLLSDGRSFWCERSFWCLFSSQQTHSPLLTTSSTNIEIEDLQAREHCVHQILQTSLQVSKKLILTLNPCFLIVKRMESVKLNQLSSPFCFLKKMGAKENLSFLALPKRQEMCKIRQLSVCLTTFLPRFLGGDGHSLSSICTYYLHMPIQYS